MTCHLIITLRRSRNSASPRRNHEATALRSAKLPACIARCHGADTTFESNRMLDTVIRQNFSVGCRDRSIEGIPVKLNHRIALVRSGNPIFILDKNMNTAARRWRHRIESPSRKKGCERGNDESGESESESLAHRLRPRIRGGTKGAQRHYR